MSYGVTVITVIVELLFCCTTRALGVSETLISFSRALLWYCCTGRGTPSCTEFAGFALLQQGHWRGEQACAEGAPSAFVAAVTRV